jgi:hypothetical protein
MVRRIIIMECKPKKYLKIPDKKRIALAMELIVGSGVSPADASKYLNLSMPSICGWMTKYWFYKKPINPVVITLKSNV